MFYQCVNVWLHSSVDEFLFRLRRFVNTWRNPVPLCGESKLRRGHQGSAIGEKPGDIAGSNWACTFLFGSRNYWGYKFAINNKQARLFKSRLYEELPVNLPDTSAWYLLSYCFTECWCILQVYRGKRNPLRCFRVSKNWETTSFVVHGVQCL